MNYVIIGGVAAGMSAAMEINRSDKNAEIIVLERGEDYSYGQCGLPYVINGVVSSLDNVVARDVAVFREKYGMDARINTEVRQVDFDKQIVSGIHTETNEAFQVSYDKLLIASGSRAVFPDWEGNELSGIHIFKTMADTKEILKDLDARVHEATVVGGGYIGLEMAESLASLGKNVTLIQFGSQLAPIFDADMAELILEEAKDQGINVVLNEAVEGFTGVDRVQTVKTDKGSYKTDFVLMGIGVQPNTAYLKDTDLHVTDGDAIIVNPYQETNIKNVYAAGDCATNYHRIKQIDDYIPLGTTANKQGRIAGANMAGHSLTFKGVVGTSIIKFFDLSLGRTGISEAEAKSLNIPYDVHISDAYTKAGYYPGGEKIKLKVLSHQETNQLLGGQIIGKAGVDKRIDVLATALFNEMTLDQLVDLDLAYAPPYNGVWDPIQQISRKS